MPPVRAQTRPENSTILARAVFALRLHNARARAISEQHAGGAILPIDDAREGLRSDHQGALECAGLEQAIDRDQPEHEARADSLQVEGGTVADAQASLYGDRAR